jgi:hypothetical protein
MANPILSGLQAAAKAAKAAKAVERAVPKIAAPQAEALRLAQQRAALPVKKGGLGLPADNTPAQRADVMFPESGFHATGADITKVDPVYGGKNDYGTIGQGFYVDPSKDAGYSNLIAEILSDGGVQRIMPLRYDASKLYDATDLLAIRSAESSKKATENIKNAGYSGTFSRNSQTQLPNEVAIFDPDVIRSRFAAFDPFRRDAATAAALGVAAPDLLANEKAKGGEVSQDAMRMALSNNRVHHKGAGGIIKKAAQIIGKAAESAGMARPVTATKDLTTLQDFHTSLGDLVRQRAIERQDMIESTPFLYDKGQRVFTKSSSEKNHPPFTILDRTLVGNDPMRSDHPQLGPNMGKAIKDPQTGKTMRTPREPGYRVRQEFGPDDWHEYNIPESAILGDVEMARGGIVRKAKGGEVSQDAMRMALWKHPVKRAVGGEAEPTPEERQVYRPISKKPRGTFDTSGAEAVGTMLSGLGAAIPAGYAGLVELARTRDPKMAAEATEDLQRRYMALPSDQKTGDKVEGMAKFLEPLSKPAQYMGEKALGLFGPEVATATEVFLDPLNALPLIGKVPAAAKAVGRTLGPTADKMVMELMQKQGLAPGVVPKGLGGLSRQEFAMDTLYPGRDFESLVSAEKSAVKRYAGALETPAVVRRETTSGPTIATPNVVMSSPKIVTPEYFKEGRPMVPFVGDTSGGGYDLSQIAGIPLSQNVPVQAGFMYPFIQEAAKRQGVYASMKGMADKKLSNLLEAAEKTGENPYGSFSAMGPESINFSTPVAESIITQLPYLQLSKKALNEFNRAIKLPSAGYLAQPNFLGVGHPDIISQLRGVNGFPIKGAGELRKKIIDLASSAKFRNMGFPHYEDIADAIIHPDLVGAPRGLTGSAIFETNPSKGLITDPKDVAHFSYDTGYHGSRPVQLKHNVPSRVFYKDIYEKGMKEGFPQVAIDPKTGRIKEQRPLTADEVTGALMLRKDLFQPTNAEWLDHVMGYLRKTHPNAGYKKGGVIKAAEGGEITSDDLIVDERPL